MVDHEEYILNIYINIKSQVKETTLRVSTDQKQEGG